MYIPAIFLFVTYELISAIFFLHKTALYAINVHIEILSDTCNPGHKIEVYSKLAIKIQMLHVKKNCENWL